MPQYFLGFAAGFIKMFPLSLYHLIYIVCGAPMWWDAIKNHCANGWMKNLWRIKPMTIKGMLCRAALAHSETMPATILLSPAAASQDEWQNFAQRGDAFRHDVHQLTRCDS